MGCFLHKHLHHKNAHTLRHKSSFMVRKSFKYIENPLSIYKIPEALPLGDAGVGL